MGKLSQSERRSAAARRRLSNAMCRGWAVTIAAGALVSTPNGGDAFFLSKTLLVAVACWLAASVYCIWWVRGTATKVRGWALLAPLLFGLTVVLTTLLSPSPVISFVGHYGFHTGAMLYVSLIVGALAAAASLDADRLDLPLKAIAVTTAIITAYSLLQWVGLDAFEWQGGRFSGSFATLGNPNYAAAFLGIGAGPLWRWMGGRLHLWVRIGAMALVLLAIFTTRSEQGFVVAAISLFLPIVLHMGRGASPSRRKLGVGAGLLVLSVVLVAGGALIGVGPAAFVGERIGSQQRLDFWSAAVGMGVDEPVTGVGFDQYGTAFRAYRSPEGAARVPPESSSSAAHSVPLQMLATGGFPTAATYLLAVGITGIGWYRLRHITGDDRDVAIQWATVWVAYQAQSFVSVDVAPLALLHWSSVAAAAVLASTHTPSSALRRSSVSTSQTASSRVLPILGSVLTVTVTILLALGGIASLVADRHAGRHRAALNSDLPDQALLAITEAVETAPWQYRYAFQQASAAAVGEDPTTARDAFIDLWERSGQVDQDAALNVARASLVLNDAEGARVWYQRFLEQEPHHPVLLMEAAQVFLAIEEPELAQEILLRLGDTEAAEEAAELLESLNEQ